jgi:hypothetical protein
MVCVTLVILSVRDADTVSTTSRLPIRRARLCPQCGYGHFDAEAEDLGDFALPFAILLNLVPGQPWRSAARCPLHARCFSVLAPTEQYAPGSDFVRC